MIALPLLSQDMEPPFKRCNFSSDEEAAIYVASWDSLPVEVWVKILANNPGLSVHDIQHMCSASKKFREQCDGGGGWIWNEIFIRQFGKDAFERTQNVGNGFFPVDKLPLLRLMAMRCYTQNKWIMTKQVNIDMSGVWQNATFNLRRLKFRDSDSDSDGTNESHLVTYELFVLLPFANDIAKKMTTDILEYCKKIPKVSIRKYTAGFTRLQLQQEEDKEDALVHLFIYLITQGFVMQSMFVGTCISCSAPTEQGCSTCRTPICSNACLDIHSSTISCGLYRKTDTAVLPVFRNVIYTGQYMQYVEMQLKPGQEIGMEEHPKTDQFFHILEGSGKLITKPKDGTADHVKDLSKGVVAMIPAGTWHNVIAGDSGLSLYTLYAPPEH